LSKIELLHQPFFITNHNNKMPHTRSASAKKKISVAKSETKWLSLLQPALPTLCQTLFDTCNAGWNPYTSVNLHCRRKNITHDTLCSARMSTSTLSLETEMSQYTGLTQKCLWGSIQMESGIVWISIQFDAIKDGLKLQKGDVDVICNSYLVGSPVSVSTIRTIVYDWVQHTFRIALSKKRSERIREELVAAVWHPRRVAKWLEEGGWDAVEALT